MLGVQIDLDALPSDAAVLQQMLRTVLHQQGALHAENDKLRLLILRLTRQQFGLRRSTPVRLAPSRWAATMGRYRRTCRGMKW
jgi:hypothetical protein